MEHIKKQLSNNQLMEIVRRLAYYTIDYDITINDILKEYDRQIDNYEKEYNVKVKR